MLLLLFWVCLFVLFWFFFSGEGGGDRKKMTSYSNYINYVYFFSVCFQYLIVESSKLHYFFFKYTCFTLFCNLTQQENTCYKMQRLFKFHQLNFLVYQQKSGCSPECKHRTPGMYFLILFELNHNKKRKRCS